ncbi:hypothetical protein [Desulfolucanica intricata]|uniref:hypothetical protein n=1 Tax=Desulfolucanica intricata TaxID=1285191 RepID=UPI0008298F2A|nr:hypothetical protein [Desulfolucanica intricata]
MLRHRRTLKILLILFALLFVVITGGWLWIRAQINDLVSNTDNTKMPFNQNSIEEWFESTTDSQEINTIREHENAGNDGLDTPNLKLGGSLNSQTDITNKEQVYPKDQKLQQIKNKYKSKLISLQGEYENRLNGLLETAKAEYRVVKEGGSNSEVAVLAQKYIGAGRALEADCDRKFNTIVNNMEAELKRNGLSTDIVQTVRQGYEQAKSERRKYLMGKALKYM